MYQKKFERRWRAGMAAVTILASLPTLAQPVRADQSPEAQFLNPPDSARPRVWWHWMNGNISEDGIAKDLAWLKRIGVVGVQAFDANQKTPQVVGERLSYMSPKWKHAFQFAASEADRLGLEMGVASSAGWSETGGPWVSPDDAMKKLVWTETEVRTGRNGKIILPRPSSVAGPYLNIPVSQDASADDKAFVSPQVYRDVAVLAYRVTPNAKTAAPTMTSEGNPLDQGPLSDDDLNSGVTIAKGSAAKPSEIVIEYPARQRVEAVSLHAPGTGPTVISAGMRPRFEASDDGVTWRHIADFVMTDVPSTISFDAVTAKFFRVVFASAEAPGGQPAFAPPPGIDLAALASFARAPTKGLKITDLRLFGEPKVNQFEAKSGYAIVPDYYTFASPGGATKAPRASQVVDLSRHMRPDGTLDWKAPPGDWRIVRMGWSLTGKANHPATKEATGLEVDKMDPGAVRRYLQHYLDMYRSVTGPALMGQRGIQALLTDSTEVGAFNWTGAMIAEFKRLRGYDPTPWLITLTGAVVNSREESDKFLYDYRRTIADLHATAHYGTVAAVAHENGLKVYGEAIENGRGSLGDDLAMRRYTDYPMAALWYTPTGGTSRGGFLADLKGASSVAHVYGQNIAAAESLTSALAPFADTPRDLKWTMDLELANGINRPVIATSTHQPVDDKAPGLSLGIFGQFFTRHETWAEMAKPWIDYIARNSYMLQQGHNVADVAYFIGEEAPLTALFGSGPATDAPRTSAYDFVSYDALSTVLRTDGNALVTPGGARYRLLYLGGTSQRMTLPALRRIAKLVEQGATVLGKPPQSSPSLTDTRAEFEALVRRLWSGQPVTTVGKGRVIAGGSVEEALRTIGVLPDFEFIKGQPNSEIPFVHRKLADGDSYFLANRQLRTETIEARFRVTGKIPELWHADTGRIEPVSYRIENGVTTVPLTLAAGESIHVVFRKPASAVSAIVTKPQLVSLGQVDATWQVAFQRDRGAPDTTTMKKLAPLNESADPGIKYFSGITTYTTTLQAPKGWSAGQPLWLDLGTVADLAEVSVNGTVAQTVWHAPYRLDIGQFMRPGSNQLTVRVANTWINRLIGDMQPGATKVAFTAIPTYTPKAPLRPAGLIGPVELFGERNP